MAAASKPYALSPIPGPALSSTASFLSRLLGVRTIPNLGLLTPGVTAAADAPIVQRSWGLLGGPKLYGPNFVFEQYQPTRNYFTGVATHAAVMFAVVLSIVPPLRWLARRLVLQPGEGASLEDCKGDYARYRAVGYPDVPGKSPTAYCEATWSGGMYECKYHRLPLWRLMSMVWI